MCTSERELERSLETITNVYVLYCKMCKDKTTKRGHIPHTYIHMANDIRGSIRHFRGKKHDVNESETSNILDFRSHRWHHVCVIARAS